MLVIRAWQVKACDGDHCAAALLSFFEYWHNVKAESADKAEQANEVAEKAGEPAIHDATIIQWHTSAQLRDGLLGLYQPARIAQALDLLAGKGFIRVFDNPNPRLKFDRTKHFEFISSEVNAWLWKTGKQSSCEIEESGARPARNARKHSCREIVESSSRKSAMVTRNREMTIVETTAKTTGEGNGAGAPHPRTVFIGLWEKAYKEATGSDYPFTSSRDGGAAAKLTANGKTPEQLIELARFAWKSRNEFTRNRTQTIYGFADQLAVVQAEYGRKHGPTIVARDKIEGEEWRADATF